MTMIRRTALAAGLAPALMLALPLVPVEAAAGDTPAPEDARVYFIGLEDGDTVSSPVTIRFGLEGMGVAPAGVEMENTGHHHLLINEELTGDDFDFAMAASDNLLHFGGGQTQATLDLPAGTHTLQLVLGDHLHVPHDPPVMSERITVTVE